MSEKLHHKIEISQENLDANRESHKNLERIQDNAEHENHSSHDIENLKKVADAIATSGKEITIGERETPHHTTHSSKQLKADAYDHTLRNVQSHLNPVERRFSKLIHRPAIETASELTSKTVVRPSGMLGGGLVSLLGSVMLLYIAKHYGFRYNFGIFLLLFMVGFLLGNICEMLLRLVLRSNRP